MSLPSSPPRTSAYSIRRGQSGWPVHALQRALRTVGHAVAVDGDFGPMTEEQVRAFQRREALTPDGVAGPKTQGRLLQLIDAAASRLVNMPNGLMRGFFESEGGNLLAAVNWSVPGGVDCGCVQKRVYGPPYRHQALVDAFHPYGAAVGAATALRDRQRVFASRSGTLMSPFSALELAVLSHNWPAAADSYSRTGTLPNPTGIASWVPASLPSGARTRAGWCAYYVRMVMRYVQ